MSLSMYCKLKQWVSSPWRIIDKLIFSEPVLERMETFEMRCMVMFYLFSGGVLVDEKVNKYFRGVYLTHFVICAPITVVCCVSYFVNVVKYDLEAVTFGVIPIVWNTIWCLQLRVIFNNRKIIEKIIKFFSGQCGLVGEISEKGFKRRDVKKWIYGMVISFVVGLVGIEFFYDSVTDMMRFTERPYKMKFLPIWCPFENIYAKRMISVLADVIAIPGIIAATSIIPFILILVVEVMYNEIAKVCAKLRTSSEGTFGKIDSLERKDQRNSVEFNESIYSILIETSNEEKNLMMETFHENFLQFVRRHQQLKRIHQLIGQFLEEFGSTSCAFFSLLMVQVGFLSVELWSNSKMELDIVVVMFISFSIMVGVWFTCCIIASIYEEENEMFADEVFAMPWYYLCPRYRKDVFVFLTITQKPAELRMLKILPLRRDCFHVFLNSVYSYIQYANLIQAKGLF